MRRRNGTVSTWLLIYQQGLIFVMLIHWGRLTNIWGKNISKKNHHWFRQCLSPGRCQAIICTNAGILSIGPLEIYFSENLIEMDLPSFKEMHLKMSSAKWLLSCLGLNELLQSNRGTGTGVIHCDLAPSSQALYLNRGGSYKANLSVPGFS